MNTLFWVSTKSGEDHYSNNPKARALMTVLDKINARMGKGSCRMAAEGLDGKVSWPMKRHRQSNRFTTSWEELPCAHLR